MDKLLTLTTGRMEMRLHHPCDGFYQGTRFDRSGVFAGLLLDGRQLCAPWFEAYDPYAHDAVQGPAEEFSPIPGPFPDTRVKIGVGLLDAAQEGYDRFRLYPIRDAGQWTVHAAPASVTFRHRVEGLYLYTKEIRLTGPAAFEIQHTLEAETPLCGEVYNHNFFTMDRLQTGPGRELGFPFRPEGDWRSVYDSVTFTPSGVRFLRPLAAGESVYSGNIHEAGAEGMPYAMTVREGPLAVQISGSVPVRRTVLWANHRIACLEPYNAFSAAPGQAFRWTLSYRLENAEGREK